MNRPPPPSGDPPPQHAWTAGGAPIDLLPLARDICRRYAAEFPDELERYGPAGEAWCVHDNQHLLAWAVQDARDGTLDLHKEVDWLARVLRARGFPIPRLARDLAIAADVVLARLPDEALTQDVAARLGATSERLTTQEERAPDAHTPRSSVRS